MYQHLHPIQIEGMHADTHCDGVLQLIPDRGAIYFSAVFDK